MKYFFLIFAGLVVVLFAVMISQGQDAEVDALALMGSQKTNITLNQSTTATGGAGGAGGKGGNASSSGSSGSSGSSSGGGLFGTILGILGI